MRYVLEQVFVPTTESGMHARRHKLDMISSALFSEVVPPSEDENMKSARELLQQLKNPDRKRAHEARMVLGGMLVVVRCLLVVMSGFLVGFGGLLRHRRIPQSVSLAARGGRTKARWDSPNETLNYRNRASLVPLALALPGLFLTDSNHGP